MARRLGLYTLGHFMSLPTAGSYFEKKLWNPLLQNYETWELSQLSIHPDDINILDQSIHGMQITHRQVLQGFFPLPERLACIERIKSEFLKNFDNLVQILSMEVEKPLSLARVECERCVQTLEATLEFGQKLLAKKDTLEATSSNGTLKGISNRLPRGLCLGATPFNFPLNLSLHKIAPALLAGAPLIWRPSPKAQLSGLALVDILQAAKVPAGMIAFLPMSNDVFWKLVSDSRISAISFTGSSDIGWKIHQAFRGPTLLELGGAAPVYIEKLSGVELTNALKEIMNSAYSYAGQSCISAQSLFVEESLYEKSKDILRDYLKTFPVGKTWDEKTLCSKVIDQSAATRIENALKKAQISGANIDRAKQIDEENYVAPALVENATEELLSNEIFGPVLNITPIKDFAEFVNFANKLPHRLQCGVFSPDEKTLKIAATQLDFGGVNLNGSSTVRIDALAYGGRGLAGLGAECPSTCYEFYAPYKTIYSKGA